jgi:hypothetical protein
MGLETVDTQSGEQLEFDACQARTKTSDIAGLRNVRRSLKKQSVRFRILTGPAKTEGQFSAGVFPHCLQKIVTGDE